MRSHLPVSTEFTDRAQVARPALRLVYSSCKRVGAGPHTMGEKSFHMKPDQSAQLKQLREHARALRIDISGARAAGADQKLIEQARWELLWAVKLTIEAIQRDA